MERLKLHFRQPEQDGRGAENKKVSLIAISVRRSIWWL
jgi:hypothetical protein